VTAGAVGTFEKGDSMMRIATCAWIVGISWWLAQAASAAVDVGAGGFDAARLYTETNGGAEPAPAKTSVPADEPRPMAGYDPKIGGFFLQSKDGKFLLKINARLQARYTYFAKDEHQESEGRDESYFELERARLGFSGHLFDPALRYKVEIDAETDASDKGVLTDAFIQYAPYHALAAGVGQFKPAFLRQEFTSSAKQQRVERSLANEFFNIDRSIGIWVEGEPSPWLYYNVALTNGIDSVNRSTGGGNPAGMAIGEAPAYVGKLDFTLSGDHRYGYEESDLKGVKAPLFVIGGSVVQQTYNGTQENATVVSVDGDVVGFGVDAVFKYKGFSFLGEYMGRWYDRKDDANDAVYAHGFNVQGGVFVIRDPDIELTARFSAIHGNEGEFKGTGYEAGPGINWFFSKSHNGKLQLDVAYIDLDSDVPSQTELLRRGNDQGFESTAAGFSEGEQGVLTRVQVQLAF